jgi:dTDP-glucose 4,6-dehydratase
MTMPQTLLITGGAGFIGTNFVHYWHRQHPEDRIVVLDALTYAGNRLGLKALLELEAIRFVEGDIRDSALIEELLRAHAVSHLVHFAAESHVDRSISGPDAFLDTNIIGTHTLLKAARKVWQDENLGSNATRFHHISTDEVYGSLDAADPAFTETTAYAPNSPYAASKAASDHIVRAYHHTYELPVVTTNCSNNYGPYQYPEKLIPLMIVNALNGQKLPVYGDGANVRDWLYVEDHCRGIEMALLKGKLGHCYNIGGHNEVKNIDLVRSICSQVDQLFQTQADLAERFPNAPAAGGASTHDLITFVTDRPGHDRRYAIDATLAGRELGFSPNETWQTGLARTLQWYLDNEDWWQAIMSGSYKDWIDANYKQRA